MARGYGTYPRPGLGQPGAPTRARAGALAKGRSFCRGQGSAGAVAKSRGAWQASLATKSVPPVTYMIILIISVAVLAEAIWPKPLGSMASVQNEAVESFVDFLERVGAAKNALGDADRSRLDRCVEILEAFNHAITWNLGSKVFGWRGWSATEFPFSF